jgi:hypothetical protein
MSRKLYMFGFKGEQLSRPMPRGELLDRVEKRFDSEAPLYRIKRKGQPWSRTRTGEDTFSRMRTLTVREKVGETILVENVRNKRIFAVRIVEKAPPFMDTPGTQAIDIIYNAVMNRFDDEYDIYNLGIYANKPGEHGKSNAWDIGVAKPKTATAIHNAILDIGNWLRSNVGKGEDLPIEGIIVMEQWCERVGNTMSTWRTYYGTPHVSHNHVSGSPGLVPGWI